MAKSEGSLNGEGEGTALSGVRALPGRMSALVVMLMAGVIPGCATKSSSPPPSQQAFAAAQQQQAMAALLANRGPNITVIGPVRNSIVSWQEDLTLAKVIVEADYLGAADPRQIVVVRNGVGTPIDPKLLLKGKDFPVQPGDVIQIMP